MTENEFVAHIPCLECGSSDANSVYSDGHTFCFVCQTRKAGNSDFNHTHQMSKNVHLQGSAERLQKRNISEKTCQFYKIFRDGDTLRFPYFTSDGVTYGSSLKLVGVQVVSVKGEAGVDTGDLDANEVAELFGRTSGFKTSDPNVTPTTDDKTEEEDF